MKIADTGRRALEETEALRRLLQALQDPVAFDHPVDHFKVLETHISFILLTGRVAYKFKKPLDLGFLNFSSLARRKHYCEKELQLNRRLAPGYYLAMIPVTGTRARPRIGGAGRVLEYAVKMIQFPAGMELDQLAQRRQLKPEYVDSVAVQIAAFHQRATVAPPGRLGSFQSIAQAAKDNFMGIAAHLDAGNGSGPVLQPLAEWNRLQLGHLREWFEERRQAGRVRECHGDLHLGNIVLDKRKPVIFDCIEFSEELRWIDVISEAAFLVMDLHARDYRELSWRFLNAYLQECGDYAGLRVLPFYLVYRALVRAKVACIRMRQSGLEETEHARQQECFRRHLQAAEEFSRPLRPFLLITRGLSGSGKTWITSPLMEALGAIRLRSDVERKRLHGLASAARTGSVPGGGIYDEASGSATYDRLAELAGEILNAEYPVIVDATFLQRTCRQRFEQLARAQRVPFLILDLHAAKETLQRRIRERVAAAEDPSEADLAVLQYQITAQEPLAQEEAPAAITVDTAAETSTTDLAARIRAATAD